MHRGWPIILSIVARAPWPSPQNVATQGRVEYPGAGIAAAMQTYWYIRVGRQ